MSIYLTGDTHIPVDVEKFNTRNFPEQKQMTKEDFVIVLGDFGLVWEEDRKHAWWRNYFQDKKFTTLWLDGNHENHDLLDQMPVSEWHGGKIHRMGDSIIHLMRGQIYDIAGKSFFVFGGAESHDKELRTPGIDWWAREEGNFREQTEAFVNLEARGNKVDYILTHTCPESLIWPMFNVEPTGSATGRFLDEVAQRVQYEKWYFGHWHMTKEMGKFSCHYHDFQHLLGRKYDLPEKEVRKKTVGWPYNRVKPSRGNKEIER